MSVALQELEREEKHERRLCASALGYPLFQFCPFSSTNETLSHPGGCIGMEEGRDCGGNAGTGANTGLRSGAATEEAGGGGMGVAVNGPSPQAVVVVVVLVVVVAAPPAPCSSAVPTAAPPCRVLRLRSRADKPPAAAALPLSTPSIERSCFFFAWLLPGPAGILKISCVSCIFLLGSFSTLFLSFSLFLSFPFSPSCHGSSRCEHEEEAAEPCASAAHAAGVGQPCGRVCTQVK